MRNEGNGMPLSPVRRHVHPRPPIQPSGNLPLNWIGLFIPLRMDKLFAAALQSILQSRRSKMEVLELHGVVAFFCFQTTMNPTYNG